MQPSYIDIKKAVTKSQHCQRNFDLSKEIPEQDLDILEYAATNCPSKQNIAFYKLHVITDRALIEEIHPHTWGTHAYTADGAMVATTNSQTLANAIFVYELVELEDLSEAAQGKWEKSDDAEYAIFLRDRAVAIGIASGYVNLTAAMLGYSTGCCQCFDVSTVKDLLGLKRLPEMIQGIGFKDETRNRREHEKNGLVFPTRKKEAIEVTRR